MTPLLLSMYILDIPNTIFKKFGYADGRAIAAQHRNFEETEMTIITKLAILGSHFFEVEITTECKQNGNLMLPSK